MPTRVWRSNGGSVYRINGEEIEKKNVDIIEVELRVWYSCQKNNVTDDTAPFHSNLSSVIALPSMWLCFPTCVRRSLWTELVKYSIYQSMYVFLTRNFSHWHFLGPYIYCVHNGSDFVPCHCILYCDRDCDHHLKYFVGKMTSYTTIRLTGSGFELET